MIKSTTIKNYSSKERILCVMQTKRQQLNGLKSSHGPSILTTVYLLAEVVEEYTKTLNSTNLMRLPILTTIS